MANYREIIAHKKAKLSQEIAKEKERSAQLRKDLMQGSMTLSYQAVVGLKDSIEKADKTIKKIQRQLDSL